MRPSITDTYLFSKHVQIRAPNFEIKFIDFLALNAIKTASVFSRIYCIIIYILLRSTSGKNVRAYIISFIIPL